MDARFVPHGVAVLRGGRVGVRARVPQPHDGHRLHLGPRVLDGAELQPVRPVPLELTRDVGQLRSGRRRAAPEEAGAHSKFKFKFKFKALHDWVRESVRIKGS